MSEQEGSLHGSTTGGVSGAHPVANPFQILVGPSTGEEFNTTRLRLIPLACWRVEDVRFDFDSSFVLPHVRDEMVLLADLIEKHTEEASKGGRKPPLAIFGHADPVGPEDYNKVLSGRRAAAIYGLLTHRDEVWEDLFSNGGRFAASGDQWGTRAIQIMLNELCGPVQVDGESGPETQKAIRTFQSSHGLPADGVAGPATRKRLFQAYMDRICVNARGQAFQVDKVEGFLARNADSFGKGDYQGCGKFNPVLIFSEEKNSEFERNDDKRPRNAANAPNRRVMALLFRPGSRVDPARWPCPRAREGIGGCKVRFFSDGEKRRSTRQPKDDRKFRESRDTFGCRFYQRISDRSPCEFFGGGRIRILLDDPFLGFLQGVPVDVAYASGATETVLADESASVGLLVDQGNFADLEFQTSLTKYSLRVFIVLAGSSTKAGAWQRLVNLGYVHDPHPPPEPPDPDVLAAAVAEFQATHGIEPNGLLDDKTSSAISANHDLTQAWKDEKRAQLGDSLASESASLPKDAVT